MSIEQWSDLMFPEAEGKDAHLWGSVKAVNSDGSYEVQLNKSNVTTRCAAGCTAGVGDRVLVCIMANGRCVAVARLEGANAEFNKRVNFHENVYLDNRKYLYGLDTGGNPLLIAGVQEENHILFGYGGWNNSIGETSLMGNNVKVSAKDGNNVNMLTGGVSIPSNSDLNDYTTVGNYTCANSTAAATLSNTPYTGAGFALKVGNVYNNNLTQTTPNIYQEIITPYGERWVRRLYSGTWYDWRLILSSNSVKDYPTAQGTSGGWHYWKFANGLAIVSRVVTCSSKIATAWGGVYESASYWSYSYPFTFAAKPALSISQGNCYTGGILSIETLDDGGLTKTPTMFLTRGATGSTYTYDAEVSIIAIGRWK